MVRYKLAAAAVSGVAWASIHTSHLAYVDGAALDCFGHTLLAFLFFGIAKDLWGFENDE